MFKIIKPYKTPGQKRLDRLNVLLENGVISACLNNEKAYKSASIAFLKRLVKDVGQILVDDLEDPYITRYKVSFGSGDLSAPDDPNLYFMTYAGKGVAVYIVGDFAGNDVKLQCRNIKAMEDYGGDFNNRLSTQKPYEEIVATIAKMAS